MSFRLLEYRIVRRSLKIRKVWSLIPLLVQGRCRVFGAAVYPQTLFSLLKASIIKLHYLSFFLNKSF